MAALGWGAHCQPYRTMSGACNMMPGCVSTRGPARPPAPLPAPLSHGKPGIGYPPHFSGTPRHGDGQPSEGPPAPNTAISPDAIQGLGWDPIPYTLTAPVNGRPKGFKAQQGQQLLGTAIPPGPQSHTGPPATGTNLGPEGGTPQPGPPVPAQHPILTPPREKPGPTERACRDLSSD